MADKDVLAATPEDFGQLLKDHPEILGPLSNIVQRRMLVEQAAEIADLKTQLEGQDAS